MGEQHGAALGRAPQRKVAGLIELAYRGPEAMKGFILAYVSRAHAMHRSVFAGSIHWPRTRKL